MPLTIDFATDGNGLVVLTDHGLERDITSLDQLAEMLRAQARPKRVGLSSDGMHLILAEWERIGPEGAGKRKRADALVRGEIASRVFDSKGRFRYETTNGFPPDLE